MLSGFFSGVSREGHAMRVVFFYPGEEGTYIDNVHVKVFRNGMVEIHHRDEDTTCHLQNCEILWRFPTAEDAQNNKVRLLRPQQGEAGPQSPRQRELASGDTDDEDGDDELAPRDS